MATIATPFHWAQRKESLFISVSLRDITNEKIDLQPTSLTFECTSDKKHYSATVNLYDEIDVENSKKNILGFGARIVLAKKNPNAKYWPRLTKEGGKHNNVVVDWERYIDSDEEGEEGQKGLGGQEWDPSAMQNFGGPGGPPQEDDSDDEDLPQQGGVDDLEEVEEIPTANNETQQGSAETNLEEVNAEKKVEEVPAEKKE